MARTYAEMTTLVLQMLQDTGATTYNSTETGFWFEESLKEFSQYDPHIVSVVFQIESRTGIDNAGTFGSLTDTVEAQFLAGDATNEKVVHNTTDRTWAVVETFTSTSVLVLNADIFASGDGYAIYNKRCWNNKQIFIGDFPDYLWIDSVEYPIGTKRNWRVYNEVLEIAVDAVADSDSTQSQLPDVDVLVRFALPHRLCQLTDLAGEVNAIEPNGETTIAVDALGSTETIEIGDEFHIADFRYTYTVTTGVLLSSGAGNITVYPGMEAATADGDVLTFVKSTLQPQHEELFAHLVAARAVLSDNINFINKVNVGGSGTWLDYQGWGERKLSEVLGKLKNIKKLQTKRVYTRGYSHAHPISHTH